ncbi:MAG: PorV/PorQ family protein [Candidatus Neomarinimicrobiota bacterium]
MKKSILLTIVCLIGQNVFAQFDYGFDFTKAGSAGFQFLKIDVGARESALGGAVVSSTADANAIFWNPAGIAQVREAQCQFTMNNWLVESQLATASLAIPFGSTVVGLSMISFQITEYEETTVLLAGGTGRMVSAGDIQIGLGIAHRFTDRLSIGGQLKYIQEYLDDYQFGNLLIDIGSIYSTGFRDLTLGFAFQHFGPDIKVGEDYEVTLFKKPWIVDVNQVEADSLYGNNKFRTPLLFRLGASDYLFNTDFHKLKLSIDMIHPTDNNEWLVSGLEYEMANSLILRGGYRLHPDFREYGEFCFGIGFKLPGLGSIASQIDYSFMNYGELFGDIHRVTIKVSI